MRADVTELGNPALGARPAAEGEPSLDGLIAELASAGLVSVEACDDGGISYALTPRGQQAARLMAMSRDAHALVLLGALVGAEEELN